MTQINITRGGILANSGFSLWFDTKLRANIIHQDNSPIHITQAAVLTDLTKTNQTSSDNSEHRHFAHREDILQTRKNHSSWFPTDRIALLVTLWKSPNHCDFTSATYQAIRECILRQKESNKNFLRIGNISLELRVWLKDTFNLKQEALTSAITASGIFQHPPHIVGNSWTGLGLEWVIQNVKPIDGIKRPDDAVSAFLRVNADRSPTTGAIRVPWSTLEQATAIHQQDYIPLTRDRYATPTFRNPLEWHDMTQEDQRAQLASKFTTQALQSHPKHQVIIYGWDKFGGRILGDILVNGQSIRQGLISNGLAREYYGDAKQSWCN